MKKDENKAALRRQKIHKILLVTFIIIGFAILIPMIGRCLADVISYPYSLAIISFVDNYWSQYSFVLTMIDLLLAPFVLKGQNQTFKQDLRSFFKERPNRYLPSLLTVIVFLSMFVSIYAFLIDLANTIGALQLFAVFSIVGSSVLIYNAIPRLLKIEKTKVISKAISLSVVILLVIPSIYFATEATKPIPGHLNIGDVDDRYITFVYRGVQDGAIVLDYKSSGTLRKNQVFPLPENKTLTVDSKMIRILNANPEELDYEILFSKDFPWIVGYLTYIGIAGFCCLCVGVIHILDKIEATKNAIEKRLPNH